jgi:hypothetical protein
MALGIDINTIQNATPSNLKKQGIDKLSELLIKKGEEIKTQIEPKLIQEIQKAKDGLLCDDINKLNKLIQTRNNIVSKLNTISKFLDQTSLAFTGVATLLNLLIIAKTILSTIKISANIGVKFLPVSPGVVTSTIDDLSTAEDKLTFDSLGNPRLERAQKIIGGSAIAIALLSAIIKVVITLLNQLDIELSKCINLSTLSEVLTPIDQNLINISNQVTDAETTINESTYKGFTLIIETIPFTSTVNQFKAIGLNSDGIKLIETPLSFTENNQTLIDELKFIIDRDNLKAN